MNKKKIRGQLQLLFVSISITILILMVPTTVHRIYLQNWQNQILNYTRRDDGAENLIIQNGKSSFFPMNGVTFNSQSDGGIRVKGSTTSRSVTWNISELYLEKGCYNLSGMSEMTFDGKVLLFVDIIDINGNRRWANGKPYASISSNGQKEFSLENDCIVKIGIWVRKDTTVDGIAYPALYKEE